MSFKFYKLYDKLEESLTNGLNLYSANSFDDDSPTICEVQSDLKYLSISSTKGCTYCLTSFEDAHGQREHYKSDWHRYNLKRALIERAPVSSEEFSKMTDDVSSISGSESESSDESEVDDLKSSEQIKKENRLHAFRDAKVFWSNGSGEAFSIYKCLLLGRKEMVATSSLQDLLIKFLRAPKKWLIVMLGGGHFAAAIFEGSNVIVHKTFHCYTVRAKQGGGQAARDNRGGNHPKSAGASLRRYNEQALVQHVQDIMTAWAADIATCSLILHRAVGPHNRTVLFGGKTPPFDKSDSRLRSIPFATRRATLKEVKRIHDILTNIQCYGSAEELEKQFSLNEIKNSNNQQRKQISQQVDEHFGFVKKKPSPKVLDRGKERQARKRSIPGLKSGSSSSDEDCPHLVTDNIELDFSQLKEFDSSLKEKRRRKPRARDRAKIEKKQISEEIKNLKRKILKFCENGDEGSFKRLIENAESWPSRTEEIDKTKENEEIVPRKEDFVDCIHGIFCEETGDTLLHIAATNGQPEIVTTLLEFGCDPTIKNRRKFVPYVLSGDKFTKNSFKQFIALNPGRFDSEKTRIPLPLSKEQENSMLEKKREKKKQQKEREKTKKKETFQRKVDEDDKVRFLALSDREKRALAAERRIVNAATANSKSAETPVFVRCFQCGVDITGKVPFEYSTHLFCSINCLKSHRLKTNSYGLNV